MLNLFKRTTPVVALAFSIAACDANEPTAQATQDSAVQDAQASASENSTDASELAARVSHCAQNHCAFNMGSCLQEVADCGGGEACETRYNACSDTFIATACETETHVALPATINCWSTFQGCLDDGAGDANCIQDLHVCAQEGCDEAGCESVSIDLSLRFAVEADVNSAEAPCPSDEEMYRWWPRPKFPKHPGTTLPGKALPKFPKHPGTTLPGKALPKFPGWPKYPG